MSVKKTSAEEAAYGKCMRYLCATLPEGTGFVLTAGFQRDEGSHLCAGSNMEPDSVESLLAAALDDVRSSKPEVLIIGGEEEETLRVQSKEKGEMN